MKKITLRFIEGFEDLKDQVAAEAKESGISSNTMILQILRDVYPKPKNNK